MDTTTVSIRARKPRDIGDVIRGARIESGMTQQELADQAGFNRQYLVDLESGRGAQTVLNRIFRLAKILRVTITISFDRTSNDD